MREGEFYQYTYQGGTYKNRLGFDFTVPASTVKFEVLRVGPRIVDIRFENGCSNKFSVGLPMHMNSVRV